MKPHALPYTVGAFQSWEVGVKAQRSDLLHPSFTTDSGYYGAALSIHTTGFPFCIFYPVISRFSERLPTSSKKSDDPSCDSI